MCTPIAVRPLTTAEIAALLPNLPASAALTLRRCPIRRASAHRQPSPGQEHLVPPAAPRRGRCIKAAPSPPEASPKPQAAHAVKPPTSGVKSPYGRTPEEVALLGETAPPR